MALTDMELAYLLTTHSRGVYQAIFQPAQNRKKTDSIYQKVFVRCVCFPPAKKEDFEKYLLIQAKKYSKGISPAKDPLPTSKEMELLEEETLALMREARDHEGILQKPRKKWRTVHTALSAVLALLIAVTVTLTALLSGGGKTYIDEQGSAEDLLAPPSTNQTGEQKPSPQPPQTPAEKDPLPPEIIQNSTTATYTALGDFIRALEQKNAPGYGKYYYNTRPLLLLPSRLPDGAVFRCLYLDIESGNYSYSFRFEDQKTLYLLEFDVKAKLPATAMEVESKIAALREEKVDVTRQGITLTAAFGEDSVTATLTAPKSEEPIDEKIVKKIFDSIALERCSAENPFLNID